MRDQKLRIKKKKKEVDVDKSQSNGSARGYNSSDKHKKNQKFGSLRKDKDQRKNSESQSSIPSGSANSLFTNQQVVFRRRIFWNIISYDILNFLPE